MELNFPEYKEYYKTQVIEMLGSARFKKKLWDWQFQSPSRAKWNPVVVTDNDEKVFGFNAVMPVTVRYDNQLIDVAWSCDFIVDKKCRGMGVGKRIKVKLHQHYPMLLALGISDQAVRVLEKMNWKSGSLVTAYRKRKCYYDLKTFFIQGVQFFNKIKAKFKFNSVALNLYDIRYSSQLPEEEKVDQLLKNIQDDYPRIVIRDYDYLKWRYIFHPYNHYNFISLWNDDTLIAMAVVRSFKNSSVLVDYIGPTESFDIKQQIIDTWEDYFPKAVIMSVTCSDDTLGKVLINSGFRATNKQRFYVYCEQKNCAENWFVMGGDSDGDMLQIDKSRGYY